MTMSPISGEKLVTMYAVDPAFYEDNDYYSSPDWPKNYGVTTWLIFAGLVSIFVDFLILFIRIAANGDNEKIIGGDMMTNIMATIL